MDVRRNYKDKIKNLKYFNYMKMNTNVQICRMYLIQSLQSIFNYLYYKKISV